MIVGRYSRDISAPRADRRTSLVVWSRKRRLRFLLHDHDVPRVRKQSARAPARGSNERKRQVLEKAVRLDRIEPVLVYDLRDTLIALNVNYARVGRLMFKQFETIQYTATYNKYYCSTNSLF